MEFEYQQLIEEIMEKNIANVAELKKYIYKNKDGLSEQYPNLFGDVELSNGNVIYNGLNPSYFRQVCDDLAFDEGYGLVKAIKFNRKRKKTDCLGR